MTPPTNQLLLPCPFCGGSGEIQRGSYWDEIARKEVPTYRVICTSCECKVGERYCSCPYDGENYEFDSEEIAASAWNMRADV